MVENDRYPTLYHHGPQTVKASTSALDSDYCLSYTLNYDDSGRPVSIDVVRDIEHESVYKLLEAYKQTD